ncbi:MAG: hypothetical protein ACOY3I_07145 [Verrucomicrobiota bacterium]
MIRVNRYRGLAWILVASAVFGGWTFLGFSQTPVEEEPGEYLNNQQQVEKDSQKNLQWDTQRLELTKEWYRKLMAIGKTAKEMSSIGVHDSIFDKLKNAEGNSLDLNNKGDKDENLKKALEYVKLDDEYIIMKGKIMVPEAITKPPQWMFLKEDTSFSPRTRDLILKISAKAHQSLAQRAHAGQWANMTYNIAQQFLPDQLLERFDAKATALRLIEKEGIVSISEGVTCRPTVEQDRVFARFANLGCTSEDEMLFWSDTAVMEGYHPLLGTALNRTWLKGYKMVDMDNVMSRGKSRKIDQWNMLQPTKQRVQNPFHGYAAKTVPGLIVLANRGQLDGRYPAKDQWAEAMRLTKTLHALPSERMKIKKTMFRFVKPPQVMTVDASASSGGTADIELPELEKKAYERSMILAKKRLEEIAKLKKEISEGHKYVNELIKKYMDFAKETGGIAGSMSDDGAIPQVVQMHKDILTSAEYFRGVLSKMSHQYDDLLQREWTILQHILQTRYDAITFLMDEASVRYRAAIEAQQQEQAPF